MRKIVKADMRAMRIIPTPIPMPAFAPVDKVLEPGCEVGVEL